MVQTPAISRFDGALDEHPQPDFCSTFAASSAAQQAVADVIGTVVATDIEVVNGAAGGGTTPTAGDDTLTGTPGNDTIDGLGGNDSINGNGGSDSLLYFTAGPDDESHGILGVLTPTPEPSVTVLLMVGLSGLMLGTRRRAFATAFVHTLT